MHFLESLYTRELQILQVCYNAEHFLQDSKDFAKFESIRMKF